MTDSAIASLIGAYINQDVFDIYDDEWAAVDDFVRLDPGNAAVLPTEIDQVLAEIDDESVLQALLQGYGLAITPGTNTYRAWLQQIADRVRAATAG